ncbi:hypothetical protein M9458_011384, partial [Cirrhinus mrigala]
EELENQLKKKDEDLNAKELQIKHLEEQLAQQRQTITEISDALRNKCLQLNKLQDALKNQGELGLLPSPIKEKIPSTGGKEQKLEFPQNLHPEHMIPAVYQSSTLRVHESGKSK